MGNLLQVAKIPPGDYRYSAAIRLLPEELTKRHGIVWEQYEEEGWGPMQAAAFTASNGQPFLLDFAEHLRTLGDRGTAIRTLFQSAEESEIVDAFLCDLDLTREDLQWLREDLQFTPCELIRQDDHGNQVVIGRYRFRADALATQRRLTAAVHKQDYWIRSVPPREEQEGI